MKQTKTPFTREFIVRIKYLGEKVFENVFFEGPILVGRQPNADIILEEKYVSRNHFQIHEGQDQVFIVTNLNSRNGLLCDGELVSQKKINERISVVIDAYEIELLIGKAVAPRDHRQSDEETQPPRLLQAILEKK